MLNLRKRTLMKAAVFSFVVLFPLIPHYVKALAQTTHPPRYKVDLFVPNELLNNCIVGQIGGMAVDSHNHIWVLQRPRSDTPDEISADPSSPRGAMCCFPAPPVLVFDTDGNLLKSWGGNGNGYDWPDSEHGIFVQRDGTVWIGGYGPTSCQARSCQRYWPGHPAKGPANSADTTELGQPAGLEVDESAHELYVTDGYLNKRVIVFDSITLAFKRMWGAYGNVPNDNDPGPYKADAPHDQQFRSPVHCA